MQYTGHDQDGLRCGMIGIFLGKENGQKLFDFGLASLSKPGANFKRLQQAIPLGTSLALES